MQVHQPRWTVLSVRLVVLIMTQILAHRAERADLDSSLLTTQLHLARNVRKAPLHSLDLLRALLHNGSRQMAMCLICLQVNVWF